MYRGLTTNKEIISTFRGLTTHDLPTGRQAYNSRLIRIHIKYYLHSSIALFAQYMLLLFFQKALYRI